MSNAAAAPLDPYSVLQLRRDADEESIRRACTTGTDNIGKRLLAALIDADIGVSEPEARKYLGGSTRTSARRDGRAREGRRTRRLRCPAQRRHRVDRLRREGTLNGPCVRSLRPHVASRMRQSGLC